MKLRQLKLSNFRCYRDETVVDLDDLVVFVGRNDAGKSTLFEALEIFFEGKPAPDKYDLSVDAEDSHLRITCVFTDVPSEIVIDSQNRTSLESEHLVNASGQLEISKVYNCGLAKPKLLKATVRAMHPTSESYGDLLSLTNAQLKGRARDLQLELDAVNQSVNAELRRAIWSNSDDLQKEEIEIEVKGETGKIWEQLKQSLPVFALFKADRPSTDQDAEAQDPMKAAVKEAIRGQEEILNGIAEKVKAEVQEIANRTVEKIQEMSPELANELTPHVSNRNWDTLFSVTLTGDADIPINKRGSGTRRLVLLNFFRAKAEKDAEGTDLGLIYAIEEPETSQHPHNQIMLVKALQELVSSSDCQVLISTHTPVLARRFNQQSLRLVANDGTKPVIRSGNDENTIREIVDSLGVLPDHNVKTFFCVEGINDINFLTSVSRMLYESGEADIPDLAKEENSGRLVFVPLGGSNLGLWVSRLQGFSRPEFYLMDRDNPKQPKYQKIAQDIAGLENCTPFITSRMELENYIHPEVIKAEYSDYLGTGNDFEDVPELFAKVVHQASESTFNWEDLQAKKRDEKVSKAKRRLNTEFVGKMTPELLSFIDTKDEVRTWLRAVGAAIESGSKQ